VAQSRWVKCRGNLTFTVVQKEARGYLVLKLAGKKPFGISRHRRNDSIKINLKGTVCEDVD
jgi:hypothetical protein